ncbi:MAG: Gfo/Idh/MocA family oxidoreductase [bacterium]
MAKKTDGGKVRIAMIGAGGMANGVHYPSLASFDDVEIVAISELREDRAKTTADKYGIKKTYVGNDEYYKEMLATEKPDGVYVIGQPNIMYPIWNYCVANGYNLYIEKPFGLSIHQARALALLAEKSGSITQCSYQRRIAPIVKKMKDEVTKRGGEINHAVCTFYKCDINPYLDARDHMFDDSVHAIDTLRWLCGGEVVEVQSICKRIGVPDINYITALLTFDNGATGVLMNNWASGRRIFSCEMHASGCYAWVEHEGKAFLYDHGNYEGECFDTKEVAGSNDNFVFGGFCAKNREFIDAIKGGPMPGSNFSDAVKTTEVAEIILANALLNGE